MTKIGHLNKISFISHRYLSTSILSEKNGTRSSRTSSTILSYHLTGKLLSRYHGSSPVMKRPDPVTVESTLYMMFNSRLYTT